MTESTTLDRHIGAELFHERDAAYLFDLSLPVRPATEDELARYAERQEDGTYAAMVSGTTDLPGPAARYDGTDLPASDEHRAGEPGEQNPLTEAREAALDRFHLAHDEQEAAETQPGGGE
jgi:hypothetical protein